MSAGSDAPSRRRIASSATEPGSDSFRQRGQRTCPSSVTDMFSFQPSRPKVSSTASSVVLSFGTPSPAGFGHSVLSPSATGTELPSAPVLKHLQSGIPVQRDGYSPITLLARSGGRAGQHSTLERTIVTDLDPASDRSPLSLDDARGGHGNGDS